MTIQDKYEALTKRYCNIMEALCDPMSREEKMRLQEQASAIEWELKELESKIDEEV